MSKKNRIKLHYSEAFLKRFVTLEEADRVMRVAGFVRAKGSKSCWVSKQRRARL